VGRRGESTRSEDLHASVRARYTIGNTRRYSAPCAHLDGQAGVVRHDVPANEPEANISRWIYRATLWAAVPYLAAVIALCSLAGADQKWADLLYVLSLPGSVLTLFFVWSTIHGGGEVPLAPIALVSALVNVAVVSAIAAGFSSLLRRRRTHQGEVR